MMDIKDNNTINKLKDKFDILKKKTGNFTKFPCEILLEDSSNITFFRFIVGYTTNQFSKEIKISYPWIYDLEHKKVKLGEKGAKNISNKLEKLFEKLNLTNKVKFEEICLNYKSLNNIKIGSNIKEGLDNIAEKDFGEFLKLYEILKKETKNFNHFPSSILLKDSKIIVVLRIILDLTQGEFARGTKISKMTVEELENGYRKLKWPATARRYSEKIQTLLNKKYKPIKNEILKKRWERWKNTRKPKEKRVLNWKNIRNMKVEDFLGYFKKLKKESKKFTEITPNLIQRNPQIIIILRILLGLTQKDLERKTGLIKKGNISNYENLVYQTLNRGRAEMFSNFFSNKIKDISEKEAIEKFLHLKETMYSYRKGALTNLKRTPPNEQEKFLIKIFKKEDKIYENLRIHENLDTGRGILNLDFVIENNNKLIIIEATKFHDFKSKKFSNNWKQRIFSLDYRFVKIKKKFPNALTFLVVELEDDLQMKYRIRKFVGEQTLAVDDIFINREFERLNNRMMEELN